MSDSLEKRENRNLHVPLLGVCAGTCQGVAWMLPGSGASSVLGWAAVVLYILTVRRSQSRPLPLLLAGIVQTVLGFHWLHKGIQEFTLFSESVSAVFFALFVLWSSFQLVLFQVVFRKLPSFLGRWGLRSALAWTSVALFFPSLFPWQVAHTQLSFIQFVQFSEIVGVVGLSFLMFVVAELAILHFKERRKGGLLIPLAFVLGLMAFGQWRISNIRQEQGSVQVALVQEDSEHQSRLLSKLLERTKSIPDSVDLIVWPERTLSLPVHESIGEKKNHPLLSNISHSSPILLGAAGYRPPFKRFKSAFMVKPDGTVPLPYNKRSFVPFGEYNPLAGLPYLSKIFPSKEKSTTAGTEASVFELQAKSGEELRVAPLICIEDLLPNLTQSSTKAGANVLVDLAAGQWTNSPIALNQHNLMAAFRSIENRRPLLRVSRKGPTVAYNSAGEVLDSLSVGSSGVIQTLVAPQSAITVYTRIGDAPWYGVAFLVVGFVCCVFLWEMRLRLSRFWNARDVDGYSSKLTRGVLGDRL